MSSQARHDARALLTVSCAAIGTWIALGWSIVEPLMRGDGPRLFAAYIRSALEAGPYLSDHLYRFGVVGGSAMHPAFGTTPVLQFSAFLGLSPTTAGNLGVLFTQICIGYLSVRLVEALRAAWSSERSGLSVIQTIVATWCCAFAPFIAWRFVAGHENLLAGLLPWLAAIALWWSARTATVSFVLLAVGTASVANALPALSQQTLVYSVVIGLPVTLVTIFGGPGGRRFTRSHAAVVLALGAGVLCAVPYLVDFLSYYLGPDSSRGSTGSMFHEYGFPWLHDFVASLPWTTTATQHWPGAIPPHETNYPVGPLVVLAIALWPRGISRDLLLALAGSVLLAMAFALDLTPVSPLLRQLPLMDAFRVPARAMLPCLLLLAPIALAALFNRWPRRDLARPYVFGAIAVAAAAFQLLPMIPSVARELLAWLACIVIVVAGRIGRERAVGPAVLAVAVLSAIAFEERIDTNIPAARLEDQPATLRAYALTRAPDLDMDLTRVQIPHRTMPFEKSLAFAAGLPTLDGVWFPPRRFLDLLGAVWRVRLSPAEADFDLLMRPYFAILGQLYNVRYAMRPDGRTIMLSPTNGPAWFVREVRSASAPSDVVEAIRAAADPRAAIARTAWVSDERHLDVSGGPACDDARVLAVTTDERGQAATIDVSTSGSCLLVVATNYVSSLRATADARSLAVLPVDVALTGVLVPAGTTRVTLDAASAQRWWTITLGVIGLLLLALAMALACRAATSAGGPSSP